MAKYWRLIVSGPADAYTNMAVDEAIFLAYCDTRAIPTLRLYTWNPPALSLGCSQDPRQVLNLRQCRHRNIYVVRRMSGGGIIFHDQELAYSITCSKEDILAFGSIAESFKILCSFLMATYRRLCLNPVFACEANPGTRLDQPSVFCFSSYARYDILIGGRKMGGNAQKRRKDFIFQHGSIPLEFDAKKAVSFFKEDPGCVEEKVCSLREATGETIHVAALEDMLARSFRETFGVNLDKAELTPKEHDLMFRLRQEKYSNEEWNLKRYERRLEKACVAA